MGRSFCPLSSPRKSPIANEFDRKEFAHLGVLQITRILRGSIKIAATAENRDILVRFLGGSVPRGRC